MKLRETTKPIKYRGAGLNNIYLANGYTVRNTRYGKAISVKDVEGLHRAIGLHLVENRYRLSGAEFRFLRKELNMSQKLLGRLIGVGEQSIASWEKTGKVQPYGDRLTRAIYKEIVEGDVRILGLVQHLNDMDRQKAGKYVFQETEEGWGLNAA